MKTAQPQFCERNAAFTLRELLVVIVLLTLLAGLFVTTARGAATRRIKVAQCAANLRQFAQATQLYATENRNWLPNSSVNWAWDLPMDTADKFRHYGMEKRTFYCPGTAPRFNDNLNYVNSAQGSSLWNFAPFFGGFHVIGYVAAFSGSALALTNQNATILPERIRTSASTSLELIPHSAERVLLADATISYYRAGTPEAPAAAGSFVNVQGGFPVPHISPHLNGNLPAGGNLAFKDGHVAWRNFEDMSQRASAVGPGFWW